MTEEAKIYTDFNMNEGINSAQAERNIALSATPDCGNVVLRDVGGIKSALGYIGLTSSAFSATGTNVLRGAGAFVSRATGKNFFMVAIDNGTETRVYAYDVVANNTTELVNTGTSNRLTTGLDVDFTTILDKVYFSCESESLIYVWEGDTSLPAGNFYPTSGVLPFDTHVLFSWKSRLGVANTRASSSEYILSAYRDVDHWDTATGNTLGDKAYGNVPDAKTDEDTVAVIPDAFGTLLILRQKSIYIMIGESPGDWVTQAVSVNDGIVAKHTALRGNNVAYYLSSNGLKKIEGANDPQAANSIDSMATITLTDGVDDKFEDYTPAELADAHAIMYKDTYRLNVGGDVYVIDLLSNNKQGALTDASVEGTIGRYLEFNGELYGIGKTDGLVYKLLTGNSANGDSYDKYYYTRELDFGDPRNLKNLTGLRVFGSVSGDYNVSCDVFVDGSKVAATTLSLDFQDITNHASYVEAVGTSTGVGAGYMDDSTQSWTINELSGKYLCTSTNVTHQIISNTATRIVVLGTPDAGSYAISIDGDSYYTVTADEGESWAALYAVVTTKEAAGNRRIDLRGKTIKLKFYNNTKDQPFSIDGFEIKYETLRHNSLATKY